MVLNHFTATGIVLNDQDEFLMVHLKKFGVWLPPGGHINENEIPDQAVLREIYEETDIQAEIISQKQCPGFFGPHCTELHHPFHILLEDVHNDGSHMHIDMIYLCKALTTEIKANLKEVNGAGWFDFVSAGRLQTFENVRKSMALAGAYLQSR